MRPGKSHFIESTDKEIRELYAAPMPASPLLTQKEIDERPAPVRRWLARSEVVGKPRAQSVRLLQRGQLRTKPNGRFMSARADQYFRIPDPAFIWRVETKLFGLLSFTGRDRYANGRGNMRIRLLSLLDVVNASDEKIASGALLRFLAEMVWFPSAAIEPYVSWEALDDERARATIEHAGLSVSADFQVDARGRIVGVTAKRFLGGGEGATLEAWRVTCTDWRRFSGVEVPSEGSVSWDLEQGNFVYYRWSLEHLEYDRPAVFGDPPTESTNPLADSVL